MKNHDQFTLNKISETSDIAIYAALLKELKGLRDDLIDSEKSFVDILEHAHASHKSGVLNLIHYLGLRRRDVRPLQERLAALGLSSLGRSESHVMSSLQSIIGLLQHALQEHPAGGVAPQTMGGTSGYELLQLNAKNLFGKSPAQRSARILVTLPGDAADDFSLIKDMLVMGMDCARINCAHDNPGVWLRIIENLRLARRETGRPCRILMDLGGPKLRTGEISLGPTVLKWQPKRDVQGKVTAAARIWLYHEKSNLSLPATADVCLPIQGDWLTNAKKGDQIEFNDARGSRRTLQLVQRVGDGFWALSTQTAYIISSIKLFLIRGADSRQVGSLGFVGALPLSTQSIRLYRGDHLILTREALPGVPEQYDENGHLLRSASISCSLPEVFSKVRSGERVIFDDGRFGGVIRHVHVDELLIEITQARDGGEKLLSDKGINFPDSHLDLCGLTALDIENLNFVVHHADMVGLSFAHGTADIELLQQHLASLNAQQLGIILKVETRAAFENLPSLLFTLLRSPNVGVMVARGDLAVECGYERLAELQEEIMWLAEAAHLPLIWATQVLEGLTKNGKPSRAEISDAAMGERSECVMLNKGPHILEAIKLLDDILRRMQGHQSKKSALLRQLHW